MIDFRTLGALDLRNAAGETLHGILTQPKRLAFLAYLALARPRGLHRRDALVAVFWPEMDHVHARAALRTSAHVILQELGAGVLSRRGDEELGLAEGAIRCDVVTFEQALAEHRTADAMCLYQGDLLEGFFVPGAPEFERWVEVERARLREQAAACAWELAEQAAIERHDDVAIKLGRQAVSLALDDESAVRRLIVLFYKVGQRAAALQAYDEFADHLAKEYETRPSAETRLLIGKVKSSGEVIINPRTKQ